MMAKGFSEKMVPANNDKIEKIKRCGRMLFILDKTLCMGGVFFENKNTVFHAINW
jgi:hypothetical protein